MKLESIAIMNYKNLENINIKFNKDITTVVGENGTGKTNLFNAVSIFFDKYYHKYLDANSFSSKLENYQGHWIIFSCVLTDIGNTAEETVITKDIDNKGIINMIYRPKYRVRKALSRLSDDLSNSDAFDETKENIQKMISNIDPDYDYEIVYKQSCIFDFENNDEYMSLVGDFEKLKFPNPDNEDTKKIGNKIDVYELFDISNITLIPAIRNVTREFLRDNNVLSKLVKKYSEKIDKSQWGSIQQSIDSINDDLVNLDKFKDFSNDLNEQVRVTAGGIYSSGVGYNVGISRDSEDLIKNFELNSADNNKILPIYNRSLGDNNITYFALKLLENKLLYETGSKKLNILLIEEPEAHIHKHIQKTLFSNVKNILSNQIILSTHSVHVSESSNISNIVMMAKNDNGIVAFHPSNNLNERDIDVAERYLDSNRIPLLFSRSVILVEGTAEMLIIPAFYKAKYNIDFDEYGISLMSMDSAFFKPISNLFDKERIQLKCSIITDTDIDYMDENNKKSKSGIKRLQDLIDSHRENEYVEVFSSKYTLEIDLFLINENEIINHIMSMNYYKRDFEKFKTFMINSNQEAKIDKFYKKVCDIGKGWFAMDLAKSLSTGGLIDLVFPEYIHNGVFHIMAKNKSLLNKVLNNFNQKEISGDYFLRLIKERNNNE